MVIEDLRSHHTHDFIATTLGGYYDTEDDPAKFPASDFIGTSMRSTRQRIYARYIEDHYGYDDRDPDLLRRLTQSYGIQATSTSVDQLHASFAALHSNFPTYLRNIQFHLTLIGQCPTY